MNWETRSNYVRKCYKVECEAYDIVVGIYYMNKLLNEIIEIEKELRNTQLPDLIEEDFVAFRDTGNRLVYEGQYFGRRKYLTVYAILALHGENLPEYDLYVSRLCEVISAVLDEKCWALPAHVDFKKYGTEEMNLTVDLFAAETGGTLAELLYKLSSVLPFELRVRMAAAVRLRILDEFSSKVPYSWWEYDRCNWSAVCAGNVGLAAIYMEKYIKEAEITFASDGVEVCASEPKIDFDFLSVVTRCAESMKYFLGGYEDDGTCTEGLGYYGYGMSYFIGFLDELLKSDVLEYVSLGQELMAIEKLAEIAKFPQKMYMHGGISVAFSDGGEKESYLTGLMGWLSSYFEGVVLPDASLARGFMEDNCYRYLTNERSVAYLEAADLEALDGSSVSGESEYLLPSAQWYVKSGQVFSFAAKGGNNDENHNHNDIGSFMLVHGGRQILCEMGAGEYTKDYFTDKRYTILNNSSLGHNVPIVDGHEQGTGVDYRASKFTLEDGYIIIEMHAAYEAGLLDSLVRRIGIKGEDFILLDEFSAGTASKVTERFVSAVEPQVLDCSSFVIGDVRFDLDGAGEVEVSSAKVTGHKGEALTYYFIDVKVAGERFEMRASC